MRMLISVLAVVAACAALALPLGAQDGGKPTKPDKPADKPHPRPAAPVAPGVFASPARTAPTLREVASVDAEVAALEAITAKRSKLQALAAEIKADEDALGTAIKARCCATCKAQPCPEVIVGLARDDKGRVSGWKLSAKKGK